MTELKFYPTIPAAEYELILGNMADSDIFSIIDYTLEKVASLEFNKWYSFGDSGGGLLLYKTITETKLYMAPSMPIISRLNK